MHLDSKNSINYIVIVVVPVDMLKHALNPGIF